MYYFDIAMWIMALAIAVAWLGAPRGAFWQGRDWAAVSVFGLAFAVVSLLRRRAYSEPVPWLVGVFCAAALAAVTLVFSHWNTMWFILAVGVSSILLMVAAAARTKSLAQPLSRYELFSVISVSAGAVLVVVLLEILVRAGSGLFNPELQQLLRINPRNYGVAHPYIGHLHTPRSSFIVSGRDFEAVHNVDDKGFRNPWPWPPPPVDAVVVGDSVSFGYGVQDDEAWPSLLRQARGGKVVNLSLVGAGPQQYLRVYETFGSELRPRVVVVAVWAINDFTDALGFDTWERSGIGGNYMVWRDFSRAERRATFDAHHPVTSLEAVLRQNLYPWLRRSYLYNLVWAIRGGWDRFRPPPGGGDEGGPRLPGRLQAVREAARAASREFQLSLDAFARIDELARRQHGHALFVLQPAKEEVYPLYGDEPVDLTQALREEFDRRGMAYIDLATVFRAAASTGTPLYFEVDGHPNATGHVVIARAVVARLERLLESDGS